MAFPTEAAVVLSPSASSSLVVAIVALGGAGLVWWRREMRLNDQRKRLRSLYVLSEEIFSAVSAAEILRRLQMRLPRIAEVCGVAMYLANRQTRTLEPVAAVEDTRREPVNIDAEPGTPGSGLAACFRNKMVLAVPEVRRSPLAPADGNGVDSVLLVPMTARGEALGVLQIDLMRGLRQFSTDQQAAAQHLGNQIATALTLLEQQTMREQLFRSEKLAAAGQLISGVADELRGPLEVIRGRTEQLLLHGEPGQIAADLTAIAAQAGRAGELISRLVSFSQPEKGQPKRLDLNDVLGQLIQFRQQEWKVRNVQPEISFAPETIPVLGAESHLDQAFLDLLLHAERVTADAGEHSFSVSTSLLGQRAVVQITFPVGAAPRHLTEAVPVARGIVMSHGGDLRALAPMPGRAGFEVLLPLAPRTLPANRENGSRTASSSRPFTVLLVEPDPGVRADIVRLLAQRKHRVVPVANAEEGSDLIERMRFDIVLCSVRLPGTNWVEFHERVRERSDGFLLMNEGVDADLAQSLHDSNSWLVRKPVVEGELDSVLGEVRDRLDL